MSAAAAIPGAALALLCALPASGCGGEGGPAPRSARPPDHVLLLVLDATHAAHLGCYGGPADLTPNIDALAARGRRFTRAVSNHTWTLPSTASLFTGQLQETHGVVSGRWRLPDEAVTLAELLADAGFRTAAFVEIVYASGVHGLDQGFAHVGDHHDGRPGMVREALAWMDEHADERTFTYLHLRRPHSPYDPNPLALRPLEAGHPLADGSRDELLAHADSRVASRDDLTAAEQQRVVQLYRANLATADAEIEPLLRAVGGRADTLVVLTSDHGEALGQHGPYGHGRWLHAECIDIPLIFAGTGVEPGRDEAPASTVDLLPTLLELCGVPAPAGVPLDGASLAPRLGGAAPGPPRPIALSAKFPGEPGTARGAILGDLKLAIEDGVARAHDRAADPGETRDVAPSHPDAVARLAAFAAEVQAAYGRRPPLDTPRRTLDPEQERRLRERLQALGYP